MASPASTRCARSSPRKRSKKRNSSAPDTKLRIVFAGTAPFAVPSLRRLFEAGHDILLVVTQPDRPAGRGMNPLASAIKQQAVAMELPVFQPEKVRHQAAQSRIRELGADLMVVVAYGQILPATLIEAPRLGTVNVHASLLPRHRGPAPIEWTILAGDQETGVTIMQMDAGVDTGPILAQARVTIEHHETAGQLEGRLATLGGDLLVRTIDDLHRGRITPTAQPADGATHAPRLSSEDGKLDPTTMSAVDIDRRVRALSGRIGTWMRIKDSDLKILRGHVDGSSGDGIAIPTIDGTFFVDELQPAGKRPMSAAAWLRGRR